MRFPVARAGWYRPGRLRGKQRMRVTFPVRNKLLFLCLLLLPAWPSVAADSTKITLVQSSYSFNFVPLDVARTEGYFAAEGLDVDVVLAGGGPKTMTALLGGG